MRKYYSIKSVKALQSCAFFVLSRKKERKKESESERWRVKEEGAETHTKKTLLLKFLFEEIQKKKIKNTRERRVLSPGTEKTTKKTIPRLERERGSAREEERWSSHFTRTTHDFIMALRQTLKQFTSKTTAFAPLLSRASGVQMYSTVIEGLKYASSHEWYVSTNSFSQSLFWVNFRFGFSFCVVREHIFLFSFSLFCFLILL